MHCKYFSAKCCQGLSTHTKKITNMSLNYTLLLSTFYSHYLRTVTSIWHCHKTNIWRTNNGHVFREKQNTLSAKKIGISEKKNSHDARQKLSLKSIRKAFLDNLVKIRWLLIGKCKCTLHLFLQINLYRIIAT